MGDLEIEQDLAFQVREWRVQRIAWAVMAALIGLAVLGLFGGGILNGVSAGDPNRLAVDYSRFPHVQDATSIRVTVPGPTGEDGRAGVTVSNSLFGDYQINSIVPEPESVTGREDENVYTFQVDGPAEITFNVTPDEAGPHSGQIGLDGGSVLDVFQLVYP